MTTELRRTVEPTDIVAVEVECSTCHARSIRRIDHWSSSVRMCVNCKALWPGGSAALSLLEDLANVLSQLSSFSPENVPFTIRLELRPEEEK